MVKIRKFEPEDYGQLVQWSADRDVGLPPLDALSTIGLIVDDVATGFLYFTNSSVALLEGFIANPKADKNDRDSAINWITLNLMDLAKANGVKVLKCESKIETVINRAYNLGFEDKGESRVLIKEL